MTRLSWIQKRDYEYGIDRGVFYPQDGIGRPWNGLISVEESPSDVESKPRYLDGQRIGNSGRRGEFNATVEAFTFPEEFESTVVSSRRKRPFGMSYRTKTAEGSKIHLVYNALASPSERHYTTDEAVSMSWALTTRPVSVDKDILTSHIVIDTTIAHAETVEALEHVIYGSEDLDATLPDPSQILLIFEENSILQIIDNGDGSWTAIGPDDVVYMVSPTEFHIDYQTAVYLNAVTYTVHSL